jgi:acetyl-CoA carboxylase/biotin carboxylase 1
LGDTGPRSASANIAEADPDATFEYRSRLLDNLVSIGEAATKLERLDLAKIVGQTKADRLLRELFDMINQDRTAAVDGIVRLVDDLTDEEKATLQAVLQHLAKHMPGMSYRTLRCFRNVADRVRQNTFIHHWQYHRLK